MEHSFFSPSYINEKKGQEGKQESYFIHKSTYIVDRQATNVELGGQAMGDVGGFRN